jgi:hypothetical protein
VTDNDRRVIAIALLAMLDLLIRIAAVVIKEDHFVHIVPDVNKALTELHDWGRPK